MNIWVTALIICISSFLFGYVWASLNACFDDTNPPGSLLNDIDLSTFYQEVATACTIIGAWIGVSLSSGPAEKLGFRKLLILNNMFFIIGGFMTCFIVSEAGLFVGRIILGIGVGVESMVVPVLLSEISPPSLRGQITLLHQLTLTIGILVAGLTGYGFVSQVNHGWQWVQLFIVFPAFIQLVLFWAIPDSPRWLIRQNDIDGARKTLENLRPDTVTIDAEIEEMKQELASEVSADQVQWSEVFQLKRPLKVGLGVLFFQAGTGVNAVIFYSTKIFSFAGVSESILATVSVGAVNVFMTIVAVYLVDRMGRRFLLIVGCTVMTISLVFNGVVLLTLNSYETLQGYLAVIGVLAYVSGYAVGLGAVAWVIMGEIFPSRTRKKAASLFIAENFIINILLAFITLTVIDALGGGSDDDQEKRGVAILFLLLAGVSFAAVLFMHFFVPETKGLSLEDVQVLMQTGATIQGEAPLLANGRSDEYM